MLSGTSCVEIAVWAGFQKQSIVWQYVELFFLRKTERGTQASQGRMELTYLDILSFDILDVIRVKHDESPKEALENLAQIGSLKKV